MKTENIDKLKQINTDRNTPYKEGYFDKREDIHLTPGDIREVGQMITLNGKGLYKWVAIAINEKEAELLKRAFKLEEIEYQETKRLAAIEAQEILDAIMPHGSGGQNPLHVS